MRNGEALAAALEPIFHDSEERFRKLAEALPAPIYTVDSVGGLHFSTKQPLTFGASVPSSERIGAAPGSSTGMTARHCQSTNVRSPLP